MGEAGWLLPPVARPRDWSRTGKRGPFPKETSRLSEGETRRALYPWGWKSERKYLGKPEREASRTLLGVCWSLSRQSVCNNQVFLRQYYEIVRDGGSRKWAEGVWNLKAERTVPLSFTLLGIRHSEGRRVCQNWHSVLSSDRRGEGGRQGDRQCEETRAHAQREVRRHMLRAVRQGFSRSGKQAHDA